MAGGLNIDNVYIQTFEDNVKHLAQQYQSKLRGNVMERGTNGNRHNWEVLDFSDAVDKTTSAPATPSLDLPWNRRVSVAQTKHTGTTIDNEDIVQMLVEPKSSATENLSFSMNRSIDDIIIDAATADALLGDGSTSAFPVAQTVGDYTTEINFDAITEIQELFMNNDVDPAQPKIAVVGPTQVRALMNLTQQTSTDFARVRGGSVGDITPLTNLMASGIVPNWMGFTWIMSTRLQAPAVDQIDTLFFCPDAIGLQVNEDITVQVAQDPSSSFAWRVYARLTMGAVRVQDKKIVRGAFADTYTP
jgi:hypothetical protein